MNEILHAGSEIDSWCQTVTGAAEKVDNKNTVLYLRYQNILPLGLKIIFKQCKYYYELYEIVFNINEDRMFRCNA